MAQDAADRIGKWLSAALEDPGVCAEMKADINAWFEAGQPVLKPETEASNGDLSDFKLHLIAQTADPHADISIEERSLYALLSIPRAAQAICTEAELETVTKTVTAAMRAAAHK